METMEETEPQNDHRIAARCSAVSNDNVQCKWRAVMLWHSVPFCAIHAPVRRHGIGGWVLL